MTDQGRSYGSQPWNPAEPGYGEQPQPDGLHGQQQGYLPQGQYVQQPMAPQQQQPQQVQPQQGPYGQGRFVPQGQAQNQMPGQQMQGQVQGQYVQPGGYPQQQDPYAQPVQYQQPGQYPQSQQQSQQPGQQQWQQPQVQQPMAPQQQQPQGYPVQGQQPYQQAAFTQQQPQPQPARQYAPAQPAPVPVPVQPAGPGPDGIDWEAEAAALDNPQPAHPAEPQEQYEEGLYVEDGEHPADEAYTEDEYAEGGEQDESFFGQQDESREAERERKQKGKKSGRRNGGACLLVALVLLGGLGGAGYWGYGYYQQTFGPPADYTGAGSGKVQIQIKEGSTATDMAKVLKDAGVVKSVGAFNNAYTRAGKVIQPGYYYMAAQMSGDSAVQMMVSEAGGDSLIIPEGKKASDIYALIDAKLKLDKGTTANAAKAQVAALGLPAYANGNVEGFLWPTRYSVSQGMKPEDLLKQMVTNATAEYTQLNLDAAAQGIGLKNAYEVLTEASILQAEGNNTADFGKMARVIYNRLTTDVTHHTLGMDTTLQYSVGSKTLTKAQINDGSNKFNTYINAGLPPTPISNPGEDALKAVLNPTPGQWAFFIAMSPTETRFSVSQTEFAANVKEYCTSHGQAFDAAHTTCG